MKGACKQTCAPSCNQPKITFAFLHCLLASALPGSATEYNFLSSVLSVRYKPIPKLDITSINPLQFATATKIPLNLKLLVSDRFCVDLNAYLSCYNGLIVNVSGSDYASENVMYGKRV